MTALARSGARAVRQDPPARTGDDVSGAKDKKGWMGGGNGASRRSTVGPQIFCQEGK